MKKGLLLINLGTPERPEVSSVRRYLIEFLTDKRVIDLPAIVRYLLVFAFIVPFRSKASAKAYQAIWTEQGSPLLINSQNLVSKLQRLVNPETCQIALAMRYGQPSIKMALDGLKHCEHLTIIPLYPQYSSAATGSSIEKCLDLIKGQDILPSMTIIRDFYQHPLFIKAQSQLIQPHLQETQHLLLSYHGLPERQLIKNNCNPVCIEPCKPITRDSHACYRAQCFETSRLLAQHLKLSEDQYSVAFQSRLGKTPWIKPYLEDTLVSLIDKGVKRLLIACPSFVSDCLETLEEVGIRAKEQWIALGGEELILVPCLNDDDRWLSALLDIAGV